MSAQATIPSPPADLRVCASGQKSEKPQPTADASVADFARLLHGTWVRRLTIGGTPVETNSFWYFDMSRPETGRGQALMIDRVNQGWDRMAPMVPPEPGGGSKGGAGPGEAEAATTTGGYWSVSIAATPGDSASKGRSGVTMTLAGDYRGSGTGPNGFRFTETGTFYRAGAAYSTLRPWRAPPMAADPASSAASGERYTPVDAVVAHAGDAGLAAGTMPAAAIPIGPGGAGRPTLTFIVCDGEIVDRYYKIDSGTPRIEGKSLKAAWGSALASGMFKGEPTQ